MIAGHPLGANLSSGITILEVNTEAQMSAVLAIREQVFVHEQGIPVELEHDDQDACSRHLIALDGDAPVATARLTIEPDRSAVLARVAVLPAYRGRGLGVLLVRRLEAIAGACGVASIILHPHARLETFYANLGYLRIEGTQEVGGNPLIRMRKHLPVQ